MTQRIPCTLDIYYNTQVWFAQNIIPGLPNDDRVWAQAYEKWLLEQGAVVDRSNRAVVRNAIGVAPGYDHLEFEHDEDLSMFALRWG
jgi:hypothetical protein